MTRKIFLTIASAIALGVGSMALLFPRILLDSKGTTPNTATDVWMTEVGILLIGIGIIAFGVRTHRDSKTLKMVLTGNVVIQIGLMLIEVIAYINGIITELSGIVPNCTLHILLAFGFAYYSLKINAKGAVNFQ